MNKNLIIGILGAAVVALAVIIISPWGRANRGKSSLPDATLEKRETCSDGIAKSIDALQGEMTKVQQRLTGIENQISRRDNDYARAVKEVSEKLDTLSNPTSIMPAELTPAELTKEDSGRVQPMIAEAKKLEAAGNHEQAGYYWRNAVEHAKDSELLSVLEQYAEAFFKNAADDDAHYAEAATLERLAQLSLIRVSPEEMPRAFELRNKCVTFKEELFSRIADAVDDEEIMPDVPERHPALLVAEQVDSLLKELKDCIEKNAHNGEGATTEEECKILQLSGVVENAMSQLWFLDRTGLDEAEIKRMDAFPKRLSDLIDDFNSRHDAPLLGKIKAICNESLPLTLKKKTTPAPHQRNIAFYTNQFAEASAIARKLRGRDAQANAQESLSSLTKKVAEEKRQQMNEYQKFVANCCKLAYDAMSEMNTGPAGYGRVPKNKGFKDEGDFIKKYVRNFAANVPLWELRTQTDFRLIYTKDNWIPDALQRSSGGPKYWDVHNEHKAFIITAIYGFYRIDQSLLTPETSRLFNDVLGKYYEKMDSTRQSWTVRWMVEEPKIGLEDF